MRQSKWCHKLMPDIRQTSALNGGNLPESNDEPRVFWAPPEVSQGPVFPAFLITVAELNLGQALRGEPISPKGITAPGLLLGNASSVFLYLVS